MAQSGKVWYSLVKSGRVWYIMVESVTEWSCLAQSGTEQITHYIDLNYTLGQKLPNKSTVICKKAIQGSSNSKYSSFLTVSLTIPE